MIGLIVLGVAFLFFLVIAFFAAKTWHWGHVVAMTFLFLFTLLFLYMTATLMRTHSEFRPKYAKAVQDYEREVKREATLRYGDPSNASGPGSLMGERKLARIQQATFGRKWGNILPVVTPNSIQLDMRAWSNDGCRKVGNEDSEEEIEPIPDEEVSGEDAGDDGEAGAGAEVEESTHGIVKGQYVFAFHEYAIKGLTAAEKKFFFGRGGMTGTGFADLDEKGVCRIPGAYLGKFLVTDSNAQGLVVQPAGQLTQGQGEQLPKKVHWVLYERLPMDSHDLFDGAAEEDFAGMLPPARFAARGIPMNPNLHRAMLENYKRDGKEVNQLGPRTTQRVEFTKEHKTQVDLVVDGALPETNVPFDENGRAQVKGLMQPPPSRDGFFSVEEGWITFKPGAKATFDGQLAAELIRKGVATADGSPVYARQLRDYQYLLNNFQMQYNEVALERNAIKSQVDDLAASLKRLEEQIEKHVEELGLLQADQKGFQIETDQLDEYKKMLEYRISVLQGTVGAGSIAVR